jgi:hypothetical protein
MQPCGYARFEETFKTNGFAIAGFYLIKNVDYNCPDNFGGIS